MKNFGNKIKYPSFVTCKDLAQRWRYDNIVLREKLNVTPHLKVGIGMIPISRDLRKTAVITISSLRLRKLADLTTEYLSIDLIWSLHFL